MRHKQPTHTHLVLEALTHWPAEFATLAELVRVTGSSRNQVSAALHHLRARYAVDVVIDSGTGYWFATPDLDNRSRSHEERKPEAKPRRTRRTRKDQQ